MRALDPFVSRSESLIESYAARIAEAQVIRRAELQSRAARLEAELSIKARSQFLANMSHELRTPLNAIIGFASMIADAEKYGLDPKKGKAYAGYILQSADLLLGHINTILETADLDGGAIEIRQAETDMQALLTDCAKRAEIAAASREVHLDVRVSEAPVTAWADQDRLAQAVDHLLRVAIKFSEPGSTVLARASVSDNGWPEIAIRDSGAGFDETELKAALAAFQSEHRGLERSFEDAGVELAIAKTFTDIQGGRFYVKTRPGKGTLVRVVLPPHNNANAPAQEDGAEEATDADAMKMAG